MAKYDYNLMVIGAGSAGLVTSLVAAGAKAKVALIERSKMGGDCLNYGCVPSKAIIRSASFMHDVKRCKELGFKSATVEFDFADVMERVAAIIKEIEPHDSVERYTGLGVECMQGDAEIVSAHEVKVGEKTYTTRAIAVCAGARPFVPPITNIEEAPYYTSETIWELRKQPKNLIVLGGGPIGTELAQAFAYLGTDVVQVQNGGQLLPREDADAAKLVQSAMLDAGAKLLLDTAAKECKKTDDGWKLICETGGGGIQEHPFDALMVATGRAPNGDRVKGLTEVGVKVNQRGAIEVDEYLRTSVSNIYACGDIIGSYQFTHTAGHAAFYCAMNALYAPLKIKVDWSVVPWCTFTHPEVARVGLNELEAKEKNIPYEVFNYDLAELDRAITDQAAEGYVKLLVKPESKGEILGVTIVGEHAGELLHEYVVAMRNGLKLGAVLRTIHVYPTWAEANRYAAGIWRKAKLSPGLIAFGERINRFTRGG